MHAPNSHIKASPPTHSHHEKYREGGGRGHARAQARGPTWPPPPLLFLSIPTSHINPVPAAPACHAAGHGAFHGRW